MKRCSTCNADKPLAEFHNNRNSADGKQARCKPCAIEARKSYYAEHRSSERERLNAAGKETYRQNRLRLDEWLLAHPCVDCGEADPLVLEFDHVRGLKVAPVTSLLRQTKWSRIQDEIDKCEVRCCNCHRKRHRQGPVV